MKDTAPNWLERSAKSNERKAERESRIRHLKTNRMELLKQINENKSSPQNHDDLIGHWKGQIEHFQRELVLSLTIKAEEGKIPHINFLSHEALCYFNSDAMIAKLPQLAAEVSRSTAVTNTMPALQDELLLINYELASLGVV